MELDPTSAPADRRLTPRRNHDRGLHRRRTADGLWGQVEWTEEGQRLVASRAYRHISPAVLYRKDGAVMGVLRASLVNRPNLIGLTALHQQQDPSMDLLTQLRKLLGLPDDADMAAVLTEIGKLKVAGHAAGAPDPAKFVPMGDYLRITQELNRVHCGIELQAATAHVDEQLRKGRLLSFQRQWAIDLCTANKPAFDEFVNGAGRMFADQLLGPSGASALPPPDNLGRGGYGVSLHSALGETDAHVASVLGLTAEQFSKAAGK